MGLRLIAVRHAKPLSEGFADETLRQLSDEGRITQRRIGNMMIEEEITPEVIFSSPLIRAQQTAEVLANIFEIPVFNEEALGYDFDEEKLISLINKKNGHTTIMFVGHEPTLAMFVNKLVGEEVLPRGLSKSAAAVVEFNNEVSFGAGKLYTVFNP